MNRDLAKHLWRSPDVRRPLKKEAAHLGLFIVVSILTVIGSRYVREKSIADGLASTLVGLAAVTIAWVLNIVRTVRAALRDHGLLDR